MSMLFRIIYATKASGTHHKLALDALNALDGKDAEHWRRLFLKHVDVYLEGAKAPDNEFKDFKNHVLHVGDEFWGGAPQKASAWYDKFVRALSERQFEEAVYCAGVFSHYYTDPLQPFHTGQSEAENNMHRAVEWSINKSYDMLRARGLADYPGLSVETGEGSGWVADMVRRGAVRSHQYYQPLISGYNLDLGVVEPTAGLSETCHRFLGELVVYASTGLASIYDRAFNQAAVSPPVVSLTLETVLATLGIPLNRLRRRLEDAADRRAVEAAYDELRTTGRVEKHLPDDERAIRDLHQREIVDRRKITPLVAPLAAIRAEQRAAHNNNDAASARKPQPASAPVSMQPVGAGKKSVAAAVLTASAPASPSEAPAAEVPVSSKQAAAAHQTPPRFRLAPSDDVEAAPSIGAKTAERLKQDGIETVADLLKADAFDLATQLNTRWISESVIRDWQDQARLVCEVAGLRGGDAQLLVGAGVRTRAALTDMTAGEIRALLKLFCETGAGKRMRGCERLPELEAVELWIASAKGQLRNAA